MNRTAFLLMLSSLLGLASFSIVGCSSGEEELKAMGTQISAQADELLTKFESIDDNASAKAALPEMLRSYSQIVATGKELEATAKKNLGRGYTPELKAQLESEQSEFSARFQKHRQKLSGNLKVLKTLQPLFEKIESSPF